MSLTRLETDMKAVSGNLYECRIGSAFNMFYPSDQFLGIWLPRKLQLSSPWTQASDSMSKWFGLDQISEC